MAKVIGNLSLRTRWILVLTGAFLVPILSSILLARYLGDRRWINLPLHTALEVSGGIIALGVGLFLIGRRAFPGQGSHYEWVVAALFCMGLLDLTHSVLPISAPFIWSRALPTLLGGIIMSLVWVPPRLLPDRLRKRLPLLTLAMTLPLSLAMILFPGAWPAMFDEAGHFTVFAEGINILGGLGFMAAAVFFMRAHRKMRSPEDFVFFGHCLLFGTAGLLFMLSGIWGPVWWLHHVLRFLAFLVVLVYVLRYMRYLHKRQVGSLESDLRKAEKELVYKSERLSLAMEAAHQGFWDWERGSNQVLWSPYQEILFGDAPGRPLRTIEEWHARVHPEDRPWLDALVKGALETGKEYQATYRVIWPETREVRWLSSRGRAFIDADGKPQRMLGVAWDVTEAKRLDQDLRNHKDKLDAVLRNINDAILVQEPSGRVLYANDAAALLLGFPSAREILAASPENLLSGVELGDEFGNSLPPDRFPGRRGRLGQVVPPEVFAWRIRSTGEERWALMGSKPVFKEDGAVLFAITFAHDITERRRIEMSLRKSEEMLRQSQKLEAIGRLAGGVAHDFNNLLTAVNGFSDLALAFTPPENQIRGYLEEIRGAGERAAGLTRQLLAFGRKQMLAPKRLNLNDLVTGMLGLLRQLIGEQIQVVADLEPGLPEMKADPTQMEQILLNLAINARDAMPKGGVLTLRTRKAGPEGSRDAPLRPEDGPESLTLSVSDTGIGMDAAVRDKIFEPFYTTKNFGKGFGLGLAMVHGIVAQSGGEIGVESAPNKGTTFTLRFPAFKGGENEKPEPVLARPAPVSQPAQDGATILVAEDEAGVRSLACKLLRSRGYRVLEASDGAEALRLQQEYPEEIHLLVTDVIMPKVNGPELAEQMLKARAGMPVLFMSGYADKSVLGDIDILSPGRFIAKPFSTAEFLAKVEQVMKKEEKSAVCSGNSG